MLGMHPPPSLSYTFLYLVKSFDADSLHSLMHSHTKAQLDLATRLSQRRRPNRDSQDKDAPVPSVAGASSRDSTASSIDSRAS